MSTRPLLIAMVLALVFWVSQPVGAHACTGVCNPDTDECCKDDCTYEDQDATCIPFNHNETCRTKKCDYVNGPTNAPTCTKGSFNSLPSGTDCIGTDPCSHGTCNGSGACTNQTNNPCEDGNQCTTNTCTPSGTQGFSCSISNTTGSCTPSNPDPCKNYSCDGGVCAVDGTTPNKPNGTTCGAFPTSSTCQVKTCSGGACTGSPVPGTTPIPCAPNSCQNASCSIVSNNPHCDLTSKPKGTVCDTDPWDCTHQRCNDSGVCKDYDTTTLKECDADTSTASHCKLSYCDSHKHCRTDAQWIHYFGADVDDNTFGHGTWQVEDASTTGRSNRVLTPQFQCPQTDSNICTSDRCVGSQTDSCHFFGCDVGDACPFPPCGDVCDNVTDPNTQVTTCTCRFN